VTHKLLRFETAVRLRIACTLPLLHVPKIAAKIRNVDALKEQASRYLKTAGILESVFPELDSLRLFYRSLYLLVIRLEKNDISTSFIEQLRLKAEDTRICLEAVKKGLAGAVYPLDHARDGLTLDEYLVGDVPASDDFSGLIHLGDTTLEKTLELYSRICARIVHISMVVENALGLEDIFRQYRSMD